MANNFFTGAATNSGDITNAGNWSLGAFTIATDVLVINATSYDLFGDLSGTGAFQGVQITAGWRGKNIGTAATPLSIKLAATKRWDIIGNPNLELVHVGAGAVGNAIPTLAVTGVRQLTINAAIVTNCELWNVGSTVKATNTTITNLRAEQCGNILFQVAGTGAGPTLIVLKQGSNLTIYLAANAACVTKIGVGCTLTVADPGSLGTSGGGSAVDVDGTLIYRSSIAGPNVEVMPGGSVLHTGAIVNITYGTVRDWPNSTFEDRPSGITVTPSTRNPVVKAQ